MNYTELVTNIADTVENSFTTAQSNMFIQLAEEKIYNAVDIPDLRKQATTALTASNQYYTLPTDFHYTYSFAVNTTGTTYDFLVIKDPNFMREAYPSTAATGTPKYYGIYSDTQFILGPTPDSNYTVDLQYSYYPESIVTATNTWLGDNFENALFNGALIEAARFLKEEQDIIAGYDKLYTEALMLLKNYADNNVQKDAYRSGRSRR